MNTNVLDNMEDGVLSIVIQRKSHFKFYDDKISTTIKTAKCRKI